MARPEKVKVVDDFKAYIEDATGVYVADYQGLNVEQVSELRALMRAQNVKMKVAKNTLVRMAMKEKGQDELAGMLTGPNAFIFGFDDPVVPARIIREFKKKAKLEKPSVSGFVIDGEFLPGERFDEVAELPSKNDLVARMLGTIQGPLVGIVSVCRNTMREFVATVAAVAEKQKESAES